MFYRCFWLSLGIITRCKTRKKNQKKTLPAPAWAVYELQVLWGHVHLLWHGDLQRLQVDICCTLILQWAAHFTVIFSMACRGISALAPWGASSVTFFTELGIYKAVSINFLPLLSLMASAQHFTPFLKYIISERLPGSLVFSSLELGGTGCEGHGEVLSLSSQKPPLQSFCTKILPHQSVIRVQYAVTSINLRGLDQDSILFTIMFWNFNDVA